MQKAQTPNTSPITSITQPTVNILNPQAGISAMPGEMSKTVVSDENAKTNIQSGKRDLTDFMSKIGAHSYTYKDEADGKGTFVSPMAQELQATELGKSAVEARPDGKLQVNYGRLSGVMLSAQATLHQR